MTLHTLEFLGVRFFSRVKDKVDRGGCFAVVKLIGQLSRCSNILTFSGISNRYLREFWTTLHPARMAFPSIERNFDRVPKQFQQSIKGEENITRSQREVKIKTGKLLEARVTKIVIGFSLGDAGFSAAITERSKVKRGKSRITFDAYENCSYPNKQVCHSR